MTDVKEDLIQTVVDRYEEDPGMLIPMMQDVQSEFGYLPQDSLVMLSKTIAVPLSRIYSVSTFYSSFRLAPKGQHEVTICMGTVCHLKGAPKISEAVCTRFDVHPGGTTSDRLFSFQAVNCVGACALAPVMVIDGEYYDHMTPESAIEVLSSLPVEGETQEEKKKKNKKTSDKKASNKEKTE